MFVNEFLNFRTKLQIYLPQKRTKLSLAKSSSLSRIRFFLVVISSFRSKQKELNFFDKVSLSLGFYFAACDLLLDLGEKKSISLLLLFYLPFEVF